ncbi:hypothetical protein HF086_008675 [Spodoptera exigua]|uniref:Uncharacterized protein n=1 Tax=Spodoptera exigua TaxID=7107 RepID=A0A922MWV6_SPOEX|nr:hypothetical protein HF086_008675 [Spodoptera exigua]
MLAFSKYSHGINSSFCPAHLFRISPCHPLTSPFLGGDGCTNGKQFAYNFLFDYRSQIRNTLKRKAFEDAGIPMREVSSTVTNHTKQAPQPAPAPLSVINRQTVIGQNAEVYNFTD